MQLRLVMAVEFLNSGSMRGHYYERDVVVEVDDKTAATIKELMLSGDRHGQLVVTDVLHEKSPSPVPALASKQATKKDKVIP